MTNPANKLGQSSGDICELSEYVERWQKLFDDTINEFYFKHKKMDELTYRRLSLETFVGNTIDEAAEHFTSMFDEFSRACRSYLIERLRIGEEFIAQIDQSHPKYNIAVDLYAKLVYELSTIKEE